MLLTETLWKHLAKTDEECNGMMDRIVKQMARREGVTEQLKSDDWLQNINSIRSRAEYGMMCCVPLLFCTSAGSCRINP